MTGRLVAAFSRLVLRLAGWQVVGGAPQAQRYVLIAAPHTTNWDFPLMMLFAAALGIRPAWLGKHTLFKPPFGWLVRLVGGIPVDRRLPGQLVEQLSARFEEQPRLVLVMPPEGSRGRRAHWKSGFYHVARSAGVPIAMGWLDYSRKQGGIGPLLTPSGDLGADMDKLRAFYADKQGLHPERQGPVRLAGEDDAAPPRE
ncbi:lysophospholipid acyltransferase family protein [Ramlibacter monticola]|uniref:lysophospholipid acyltransferase family protein n=1 Tax=Ramlibacter monticola TaxID=1926872 RepID=UPI002ED17070